MSIRSTHLTLSVAAGVIFVAGSTAVAMPVTASDGDGGATLAVQSQLRDLNPAGVDPTDGARSKLTMKIDDDDSETEFTLRLEGLDPAAAGRTFGAHLHFGPCVAGNGPAALGHYNTDVVAGRSPARISPDTEVWLDFTVTKAGRAEVEASVPFAPSAGIRSIVIHHDPTHEATGAAGARLACLPVAW